MNNEYGDGSRLIPAILAQSHSSAWNNARLEWWIACDIKLKSNETTHCVCGTKLSASYCILVHQFDRNRLTLGRDCAKFFNRIGPQDLCDGLPIVRLNPEVAFKGSVIQHLYGRQIIDQWERDFYVSTYCKKQLTFRQLEFRVRINEKITLRMGGFGHA